jgi:hypothetical protein
VIAEALSRTVDVELSDLDGEPEREVKDMLAEVVDTVRRIERVAGRIASSEGAPDVQTKPVRVTAPEITVPGTEDQPEEPVVRSPRRRRSASRAGRRRG